MSWTRTTTPVEAPIEMPFLRVVALPLMAQAILPLRSGMNGAVPPGRWVEILVRPEIKGRSLTPGDLMERVARAGQARAFDNRILSDVLTFLDTDSEIGLCSVNVSGQSLSDRGFLRDVLALINASDVDPRRLCFEITEISPITDFGAAKAFAKVLRRLGCRIALDDFGGGMSNLPLLAPKHVDYLKIDGRFVRRMDKCPDSTAVVRGLVALAREVGLKVIAECVETSRQFACAKRLGIDFYQGYFRQGEPKPLARVPEREPFVVSGGGALRSKHGVFQYE